LRALVAPGPFLALGQVLIFPFLPIQYSIAKVAFGAILTGSGISSINNLGLWTNVSGPLTVVARSGSEGPGPNVGAGVNFSGYSDPAFNDADQLVLRGDFAGSGVDSSNNQEFGPRMPH
jgi:hypothetical protein